MIVKSFRGDLINMDHVKFVEQVCEDSCWYIDAVFDSETEGNRRKYMTLFSTEEDWDRQDMYDAFCDAIEKGRAYFEFTVGAMITQRRIREMRCKEKCSKN